MNCAKWYARCLHHPPLKYLLYLCVLICVFAYLCICVFVFVFSGFHELRQVICKMSYGVLTYVVWRMLSGNVLSIQSTQVLMYVGHIDGAASTFGSLCQILFLSMLVIRGIHFGPINSFSYIVFNTLHVSPSNVSRYHRLWRKPVITYIQRTDQVYFLCICNTSLFEAAWQR